MNPDRKKHSSRANHNIMNTANYYTKGKAPRRWQDYLAYPRVLFTVILCTISVILHVAFGFYVWFFEK